MSVRPVKNGVFLQNFIFWTVHAGLWHFSAYNSYKDATCLFWWYDMLQDCIACSQSCEMSYINNKHIIYPAGRYISLSDSDKVNQSLAIGFSGPFKNSNEYTTVFVIMSCWTSYIHSFPLMATATSQKTSKKFQTTIFDTYDFPCSNVLDQNLLSRLVYR